MFNDGKYTKCKIMFNHNYIEDIVLILLYFNTYYSIFWYSHIILR